MIRITCTNNLIQFWDFWSASFNEGKDLEQLKSIMMRKWRDLFNKSINQNRKFDLFLFTPTQISTDGMNDHKTLVRFTMFKIDLSLKERKKRVFQWGNFVLEILCLARKFEGDFSILLVVKTIQVSPHLLTQGTSNRTVSFNILNSEWEIWLRNL